MYVSPSACRQGVAQELIKEVLTFSEGMESKGVLLETDADNVTAQQLYEKMGFIREESYHFFYSSGSND